MRIQTRLFLGAAVLVLALMGLQWWLYARQLRSIEDDLTRVATSVGEGILTAENVFFGNDLILAVHTAETSRTNDYRYGDFVTTTDPLVFTNLDEGLMRVTLTGDWTNAAPVSATINIYSVSYPFPGLTSQSKIADGDFFVVPFEVPAGTSTLDARLSWRATWGQYPVNDLDVILVDPDGGPYYNGATLNSPERVHIDDPIPGEWLALIDGYTVYDQHERYELVLQADGKAIH